jgi:hypothetical protein
VYLLSVYLKKYLPDDPIHGCVCLGARLLKHIVVTGSRKNFVRLKIYASRGCGRKVNYFFGGGKGWDGGLSF